MVAFIWTSPGSNKNFRTPPSTSRENCQACIISLNSWQTSTSPSNRWKSDRPRITSWAGFTSIPTPKCRVCRGCSPPANAQLESTARIGSAEIRSPIFSFSENARASSPPALKNLLTVSEAITRAALERKESRGAQFREDYPNKEERFAKVNTIISKAENKPMRIRLEPLPEMPDYLKRVVEENG